MDYARATAPLPEIAGHIASLYRSFWSLESLPPEALDWPLWLGCAEDAPYRDGLVGLRWR